MPILCECMKTDCEIDCNARECPLRSCLGHQITQGQHWTHSWAQVQVQVQVQQSLVSAVLGFNTTHAEF